MTFYGSERIQQLLTYLKNYLTEKFAAKQDKLTFDAVPTENSMNPVRSGGVHDALSSAFVDKVTNNDMRGVTSNAVYDYIDHFNPYQQIQWFNFNEDLIQRGSIYRPLNFDTEYTFIIPSDIHGLYHNLEFNGIAQLVYHLSNDISSTPKVLYTTINIWTTGSPVGGRIFIFKDIDDEGNLFFIKGYEYEAIPDDPDYRKRFKLKIEYANGYTPSTPTTLEIEWLRQSGQRWAY